MIIMTFNIILKKEITIKIVYNYEKCLCIGSREL
jgi:hypothetical protein